MTVVDIKTGRLCTRDIKDAPVVVTQDNWDNLCNNAKAYKELFCLIEKRLQKLERQAIKPNWWEWWR